jgi:hypothetical protein
MNLSTKFVLRAVADEFFISETEALRDAVVGIRLGGRFARSDAASITDETRPPSRVMVSNMIDLDRLDLEWELLCLVGALVAFEVVAAKFNGQKFSVAQSTNPGDTDFETDTIVWVGWGLRSAHGCGLGSSVTRGDGLHTQHTIRVEVARLATSTGRPVRL